jgi:hypothetical protein
MKPKNFKKYLLLLLLTNIFLFYGNLAYAANSADYTQNNTNPVSSQIEQYLCAPTSGGGSYVSTNGNYFGTTPDTAVAANNTASNDLYLCINRLYKFAIAIGTAAGVLMIVIAGYLYMSSDGNQESVDKAKSILTSTITAMVILFAGYVLLRAINPDLIAFQNVQPPSVKLDTMLPPSLYGQDLSQVGVAAGLGGVCQEKSVNLCQAQSSSCGSNACGAYSAAIKDAASKYSISGINTEALIRSIMFNESSCGTKLTSTSNPPSCGIMQLQPDTANALKAVCGVSDNITCAWLNNQANFTKSICIGAYYLKQLSAICGNNENNVVNLAAGYNAGATACQSSTTCSSETSCSGGTKRKWECLYDGATGSKTECNTGYTETRSYAPKVLDCYNKNK